MQAISFPTMIPGLINVYFLPRRRSFGTIDRTTFQKIKFNNEKIFQILFLSFPRYLLLSFWDLPFVLPYLPLVLQHKQLPSLQL